MRPFKYAPIHLVIISHDWWHQKMIIMGHDQSTSYEEFTKRLIEKFDPKHHFKKLA